MAKLNPTASKEMISKFSIYIQRRIIGGGTKLERFNRGESIDSILNEGVSEPYLVRFVDGAGKLDIISTMNYDYKKDLNTFIDDIEKKAIKYNSVIVGKISSKIQSFLKQNGVKLYTRDVVLEVGGFFHILNKVKQDTQLPKELIRSFDEIVQTPKRVFFDTVQKHINLIYVDSHDGRLFKVVVQPNYHVKKDIYTNEIVSAGYIEERNLKDESYIETTNLDGE